MNGKKVLSVAVAAACLMSVCSATAIPGFATAGEDPNYKLTDKVDGENVIVTLEFTGEDKVAAGNYTINYDTEVFELVSAVKGSSESTMTVNKNTAGQVRGNFYYVDGYEQGGTDVVVVTLKMLNGSFTEDDITLTKFSLSNIDSQKLADETTQEAEVTVDCGHTGTHKDTTPGTCSTSGKEDTVCDVCGTIVSTKDLGKADHVWNDGEVTQAATCTAPGQTTFTCTVCGETKTEEIPATDHHYDDGVVTTQPTCEEPGVKTYTCIAGDDTYTEAINALGHDYDDGVVTTEPTCNDKGVKTFTCSRCRNTYTEDIDALGHNWNDGEVTLPATCTDKGIKTYTCSRCGETKTEDIPALGHDYDNGVITTEPTCTEKGVKTFTCNGCQLTYTEDVDALGHDYGEGVVTTEPTCTEKGVKTFTCSRCGDSYTEEIDALGHSYTIETVTKEPTCTEKGEKTVTCDRCGDVKEKVEIDMIPHSYDEGVVTKEATETEKGEKTYTCTVCGDKKTEEIPVVEPELVLTTLTDNGVTVSGMLPVGIVLKVTPVKPEGVENLVSGYDIKLEKADGTAYEYKGAGLTVTLPDTTADCEVYYLAEDGTKTNMNASVLDGKYVFDTTHFSVYILVSKVTTPDPDTGKTDDKTDNKTDDKTDDKTDNKTDDKTDNKTDDKTNNNTDNTSKTDDNKGATPVVSPSTGDNSTAVVMLAVFAAIASAAVFFTMKKKSESK